MWVAWLAIVIGFAGLVWSADRFVGSSAAIANRLGVSRLVIGLTIVSLGTSAPEIVVSISASLKESGELAIGNALGSNIANIGLVLAITALVSPLPVQNHLIRQEIPILLLVTAVAGVVLYDARLSVWEGALMLLSVVPLIWVVIISKRKHHSPEEEAEIPAMGMGSAVLWFAFGLAVLIASSELLVWGARSVATAFGVSPLVIGLTVIAIGTSLPELAASIASALKGHHEMAIGNIIGSNIFNLLTVMAIPGVFHVVEMENSVFFRDFAAMAAITLLLAIAIFVDLRLRVGRTGSSDTVHLGRIIGGVLLVGYIGYYYILFG